MIVFDSSTLILLARTELLERFLIALKEKVCIPQAVERECCEEKDSVDALMIRKVVQDKRIVVKPLRERKLYGRITEDFHVGRGEAEAIALAFSEKARLVATDDKRAIQACTLLKIPYTTALDVLVRMHEKGLLEKEEALLRLEALERYGRYKKALIEDVKSTLGVT